ncbi:hypothetical protein FIBSPDRAFT_1003224 [Athelia psychrophila]|uniref:Zn(2)-C6 fungal-type domain-containing protein n=1 Tax=Athelia psychrophila TaxID=1759441 RepID=A0A166Q674_9AGAM|nr:hypothetical protein FIBSPDRAFT_1003224 [Fibularhizoctonia sp. CBS 109695]
MRDTTSSRRNSRKLTAEEEIELRRARGELSCAECKRLKLKCDKNLPCSSCVRRGCPTLCPHGSLTNGQGSRFILTDTDGLHQKISEMSQRIRQLEDALGLLQSSLSSEKHPLLREELLSIKYGPEQRSAVSRPPEDPLAEPVEVFGTMTIGDRGESRYFGATAGSEVCLTAEPEPEDHPPRVQAMPELLKNLAAMFPVGNQCPTGPKTFESAMSMLVSCLPDRPRAWSLCENFLEQASWLMRPVKREELIQDIMNPVYAAKEEHENTPQSQLTVSPHKISILYSIFALGCLADLTLPAFNREGECYHHYARAALTLRSMFESPVVETVQAILFLAYYCINSAQRYNRDSVWMLVSLGAKAAQSVNRDPARWNIDARMVERRRALFWEIYSFDVLHSLALGRPPSIALCYVDCALPQAQQDDSDAEYQFWNWKYQFTRDIYGSILELTLGAKSADYKAILEVDRRVRETPMPPALDYFLGKDHEEVSPSVYMKGGWLLLVRPITMLYLHKNFFARALLDHPTDPLASPYATSFLAAARSASSLIKSAATHIKRFPDLCMRWLNLWIHLFSAAMIVGSIVTKAPSSSMAPAAFTELVIAVELFENGGRLSQRIRRGNDILHRLREKASVLFARYGNSAEFPAAIPIVHDQGQDNDNDALAIFSGQARGLISVQRSAGVVDKADSSPQPPASITIPSLIADLSAETTTRSSTSNMGVLEAHSFLEEEYSLPDPLHIKI